MGQGILPRMGLDVCDRQEFWKVIVSAAEIERTGGDRAGLPNDLGDRLHQARDILQQRLDDPQFRLS